MYRVIKRLLDILVSLVALIVLFPLILLLALMIRIESPGAPIFSQQRIGKGGAPFTIYKLRSMKRSAPRSVATEALSDASQHITRLGSMLRKTSLDELPQLVNILRGDMSLVGPRPLVPEEESVHAERHEKNVYIVRPGITGWAQVNGRDEVHSGMKADLDAYYVQNISFRLDAVIVFRTVRYVLTARGIQEGDDTAKGAATVTAGKDCDAQSDHH